MKQNYKLIADIAIFSSGKVLFVKYTDVNKYDHQKGWFLPDDLINFGEHPGEAIRRIVKEQLGIDIEEKLDHLESFTGKDKSWHLVFHYQAEIDKTSQIEPSVDIEKYQWFETGKLPQKSEIAHNGWAAYTIENIKGHIEMV